LAKHLWMSSRRQASSFHERSSPCDEVSGFFMGYVCTVIECLFRIAQTSRVRDERQNSKAAAGPAAGGARRRCEVRRARHTPLAGDARVFAAPHRPAATGTTGTAVTAGTASTAATLRPPRRGARSIGAAGPRAHRTRAPRHGPADREQGTMPQAASRQRTERRRHGNATKRSVGKEVIPAPALSHASRAAARRDAASSAS
jgi:hypothetical protein